ncbi:MAG: 3-deoxy-D-manno-octulosonic acid transferase [Cyanobacteria bacterium HKST-UBA04]|nr:3-deoxy-D-manno-octulosonic acid transferase [Cyanobacteria bacterium HKST-UBA04]
MIWLLLYNAFINATLLLGLPLWLVLLACKPKWRAGLAQKLGIYHPRLKAQLDRLPAHRRVWIHAVSVGELNAAAPLIDSLLGQQIPVIISTTTATGQARARQRFPYLPVLYFPLDLPSIIHRALTTIKPTVLVTMETELWPNLAWMAHQFGVAQILVNGRLSPSSFAGYKRFGFFFKWMLAHFDRIMVQSPADAERFRQLGVTPQQLSVMGSVKYDGAPAYNPTTQTQLRKALGITYGDLTPVVVLASSHRGEDAPFIELVQTLKATSHPKLKAIIVPRHPERFDAVAKLLSRSGLAWQRRSQFGGTVQAGTVAADHSDVLLLDTMGELVDAYAVASVAVIGGSFVDVGGHNPIEAIKAHIPVIFGPHMKHFAQIAGQLVSAEAALQVHSFNHAARSIAALIDDYPLWQRTVSAGQHVLAQHRGATERALEAIIDHLAPLTLTPDHVSDGLASSLSSAESESGSAKADTSLATSGLAGGR